MTPDYSASDKVFHKCISFAFKWFCLEKETRELGLLCIFRIAIFVEIFNPKTSVSFQPTITRLDYFHFSSIDYMPVPGEGCGEGG